MVSQSIIKYIVKKVVVHFEYGPSPLSSPRNFVVYVFHCVSLRGSEGMTAVSVVGEIHKNLVNNVLTGIIAYGKVKGYGLPVAVDLICS